MKIFSQDTFENRRLHSLPVAANLFRGWNVCGENSLSDLSLTCADVCLGPSVPWPPTASVSYQGG